MTLHLGGTAERPTPHHGLSHLAPLGKATKSRVALRRPLFTASAHDLRLQPVLICERGRFYSSPEPRGNNCCECLEAPDATGGNALKEVPMARIEREEQAVQCPRSKLKLSVVVLLALVHFGLSASHARDSGRVDPVSPETHIVRSSLDLS